MAKKIENEQDLINKVAFGLYIISEVGKAIGLEKPTKSDLKNHYEGTEDSHSRFSLYFDLETDALKKARISFLAECANKYSVEFQNLKDFKASKFYTDFCKEAKNYLDDLSSKLTKTDAFDNFIEKENKYSLYKNITTLDNSELARSYLNDILLCEERVHSFEFAQRNRKAEKIELEVLINSEKVKQMFFIEELQNLISVKFNVITPAFAAFFSEKFVYEYNSKSLQLCKQLLPIAKVIATKYLLSEDDKYAIDFKMNFLKVLWHLGEKRTCYDFFPIVHSQIKRLNSLQTIDINYFQNTTKTLLDYGCSINPQITDEYRDFAYNFEGDISEKSYAIVTAHQCSACRYLREEKLENAEKHLQEAELFLCNLQDKKNKKKAHFYFMKGTLYYKKGSEYYEIAYQNLKTSINYLKMCGYERYSLEMAFVYYLMFKMGKHLGEAEEFKTSNYGLFAYEILCNSVRKNYCLFDYWEVRNELEKIVYEE